MPHTYPVMRTARSAERIRQEIHLEQMKQAGKTERTRMRVQGALQLRALTVATALVGALIGGPVVSQPAPTSAKTPIAVDTEYIGTGSR